MKKQIIMTALVLSIVGVGALTSTKIFAQTTTPASPMSSLVQKIADKFGLNVADVQSVFEQERTERQAEMQAKYETQLTQYVAEGKITEAQKQLIVAKHKELSAARQSEMQSMAGRTPEERKAAMEAKKADRQAERTALEDWATKNGIDVTYVMGGFGKQGGRGFGGMKHGFNVAP